MNVKEIFFSIIIGMILVAVIITCLVCFIYDKVLVAKIKRIKEKYSTLYKKIVEYDILCNSVYNFYNANIAPLKKEIDKLCEDNYTLEEVKNTLLREKRLKLLNLQNEYDKIYYERKSLYDEIQAEVDKCDKDINVLWTQSEDNK